MKYKVLISKKIRKSVLKFPRKNGEKILERLEKLSSPFSLNVIKMNKKSFYRDRVGDYRIVFSVDKKNKIVEIKMIDHRKSIYNKLVNLIIFLLIINN